MIFSAQKQEKIDAILKYLEELDRQFPQFTSLKSLYQSYVDLYHEDIIYAGTVEVSLIAFDAGIKFREEKLKEEFNLN